MKPISGSEVADNRKPLKDLLFLGAVLKGVHSHAGLLRAAIASSGNDHRLGANEAPPAIISVFLGDLLNEILDKIESGRDSEAVSEDDVLKLGVGKLPEVMKDNTDRNRTSPFAFTGNKFEFRAVGSTASTARPMTMLNAAVADGLENLSTRLEEKLKDGGNLEAAGLSVLKEIVTETKSIRFEGNNYAGDWVKEAKKRGLPNHHKTPESLDQLLSESSKKLLTRFKIFTDIELESRYNVLVERYNKALFIEAQALGTIVDTQILPAAYTYHGELTQSIAAAKAAGLTAPQVEVHQRVTELLSSLQTRRVTLEAAVNEACGKKTQREIAQVLAHKVTGAMDSARETCDELELVVADHHWPLPKYREMLFISE